MSRCGTLGTFDFFAEPAGGECAESPLEGYDCAVPAVSGKVTVHHSEATATCASGVRGGGKGWGCRGRGIESQVAKPLPLPALTLPITWSDQY